MKESEIELIDNWIAEVSRHIQNYTLSEQKSERAEYVRNSRKEMGEDKTLKIIREQVNELCGRFSFL